VKCPPRNPAIRALTPLILWAASLTVFAELPPTPPRGVSIINTDGNKALRNDTIMTSSVVDMISLQEDWNTIESADGIFTWSTVQADIEAIANNNKSALLRIPSMGGSVTNGGKTPDWVFVAMKENPASTTADPGTTYAFDDGGPKCIPVFWQQTYLAKKKALIAMAGANLTNESALKVFVVSYANSKTEDWSIPHDNAGSPSQVQLWQNQPGDPVPGAGYTTQKMIDAAIHQGDATFADGVVSNTTTLSSLSATFTQADVGCSVAGPGYQAKTRIVTWISPTQVTLNKSLRKHKKGKVFTIVARRDGLIDVAMAAFPNQYIASAVSGNGPDLDAPYVPVGEDPGTYLPKTVDNMASTLYGNRYIVQRNNVSATTPYEADADDSTAWSLLADADAALRPTAGQALGVCWNNEDYRMNGSTNCDWENSDCEAAPDEVCGDPCALDYATVLSRSAERLYTYHVNYYELYPPDFHLYDQVASIHDTLTGP